MKRAGRFSILTLLSLAVTATATAASRQAAVPFHAERAPHARVFADGGLTLDEAVARAERRFDARVVRAEQKNEDGRLVYRIRLLSADGRVFEVKVDARSGAQL